MSGPTTLSRTHDGRRYGFNVLDEFSHECLAIRVARKLKAIDVIDVLSDLFILRGVPAHIRSDNEAQFSQGLPRSTGPRPRRQSTGSLNGKIVINCMNHWAWVPTAYDLSSASTSLPGSPRRSWTIIGRCPRLVLRQAKCVCLVRARAAFIVNICRL